MVFVSFYFTANYSDFLSNRSKTVAFMIFCLPKKRMAKINVTLSRLKSQIIAFIEVSSSYFHDFPVKYETA
jgi:hypothetical protein